jgi:hypothetical protein
VREPILAPQGWVPCWHAVIKGEPLEIRIKGKADHRATREEALADLWDQNPLSTRALYQEYPELQAAELEQTTAQLEEVLKALRAGTFGQVSEPGARFRSRMADLVDAARSPENRHANPQTWACSDQETDELVLGFAEDPDPMFRRVLILSLTDQALEHSEGEAVVPPAAWMKALYRLAQADVYQSELGDLATRALRSWNLRTQRMDDLIPVEPIFRSLKIHMDETRAADRSSSREEALDKWENPVLAEWAKGQGFTDPTAAFGMEDHVGHFDFGSWGLNSLMGTARSTPFSTDYGGRTYIVEWTDTQKASVLMARLRREMEGWFEDGLNSGRLGSEDKSNLLRLRGDLETVHQGFLCVPAHSDNGLGSIREMDEALRVLGHLETKMLAAGESYWSDRLPEPVRDIIQCALAFKPYLEARSAELCGTGTQPQRQTTA